MDRINILRKSSEYMTKALAMKDERSSGLETAGWWHRVDGVKCTGEEESVRGELRQVQAGWGKPITKLRPLHVFYVRDRQRR